MTKFLAALPGTLLLGIGLAAATGPAKTATHPQPMASSHAAAMLSVDAQNTLVSSTCATCHDNDAKTGGLTLEDFDAATIDRHPETAEKMIKKLRAGMMPPPTFKDRPDPATLAAFATSLETKIDTAAALHPNPGRRSFQRLNRAEYARSVHDLLDIDVDVNAFLPPDTMSHGFDNISEVQSFSPTLMEGYLRAASKIASTAIGDKAASPTEMTIKVPRTESQMEHVEGTPWGTRGGVSVVHNFPADGDYTFRILLHSVPTGQLYGSTSRGEQIEISINGRRVALMDINYRMTETDKNGLNLTTPRIHVNAGPQHVAAAFIKKFEGPIDDLMAPIDYTLADSQIGDGFGITTEPHVRDFSITGPYKVTGISDTPSRRKIFVCRPTSAAEEAPCATHDPQAARDPGLSAARHERRSGTAAQVLQRGAAGRRRLRVRHQARTAGDPREPSVPVPPRRSAAGAARGTELSDQRSRSRLSPVLLLVGQRSRCGASEGGDERHASGAGRFREAGAPHAGRPAVVSACRPASPPSGCGCRTWTRSSRTRCCIRRSITTSRNRSSVKRSCSSTASSARIETFSIC